MNNAAENNTQKNNNGISQKDDRCCKLSVVVSVYNEEKALREFYKETNKILEQIKKSGWEHELIFVNDGSADNSLSILEEIAHEDHDVKLISFSRNFGHEAAMIAGIDYSTGDGIICMDADLQHPPECIPEIIEKFNDGYEVINMVRTQNKSAGLVKNITSSGFYWLINHISDVHFEPNASDFFAISRHVAQVLKDNYREKVRFLRGYVQNVGFKKTNIEYEARARVAGESKYSIKKLFIFSMEVCHEMLRSFWQIQHRLKIDDLRGSRSHTWIELCKAFQVFQFHFFFHKNAPSLSEKNAIPKRYSVFFLFLLSVDHIAHIVVTGAFSFQELGC